MSPALRSRIAVAGLLGVFLIPLVHSATGRTHALTCRRDLAAVSLKVGPDGTVAVGSATGVRRNDGPKPRTTVFASPSVCGGLLPSVAVHTDTARAIRLEMGISNRTVHRWHVTMRVQVGDSQVPIDLGALKSGESRSPSLRIDLGPGTTELRVVFFAGP